MGANRMRFFGALIVAASGVAIMPVASAEDAICAITPDHPLVGDTRWYGLYYNDQKIGHASTSLTIESSADGEMFLQQFSMTFKLEQSEETIEQRRRFQAKPPHELIDGRYRSADREIDYQQRGRDLHLMESDVSRIWRGVDRDLCDEEELAIHRILETGAKVGASFETADFDVEHQTMIRSTHELETIETRRILGADHHIQTMTTSTSSSDDTLVFKTNSQFQNGEAVNIFIGPMEFRAESEAIANSPNTGVDLFAEFEKPLRRPLSDLWSIKTLTLRAVIDDQSLDIKDVVEDGVLQKVVYPDIQTAIIEIADRPATLAKGNSNQFLRPTSSHPADHPRLQNLAREITSPLGPNPDNRLVADAILSFVSGYIETVPKSPYVYHTTSVFDILDNRIGDCTEYSQLFVTLARAAGLPAREATGFVYNGDDRAPTLAGHAWVEVLIDGRWIGMDPTWGEKTLNKSHVQIKNTLTPSLTFEIIDIVYH